MFIQVIEGKCSRQDDCRRLMEQWRQELAPAADGWLGSTYGFTDDDTFVTVARFESRDAAMANSERAEQGAWWAEMEELFDGPVAFADSDDVSVMFDGGSDSAGFVQVIRGKATDPEALKAMLADTGQLREMRPDIIGATLALEPDGSFTQTVAFTDEESARKGEQVEMPEDRRQELEAAMQDVRFLDLHQPRSRRGPERRRLRRGRQPPRRLRLTPAPAGGRGPRPPRARPRGRAPARSGPWRG